MKNYRITINGRSYRVEIDDIHASPIQATVDGEAFVVTLEQDTSPASGRPAPRIERVEAPAIATTAPRSAPAVAGSNAFIAPMPGVILEVRVVAGQTVTAGQELCILEAMKMKNSLKSPRAGVIAEVKVSAGQTVAYGDALILFQ